MKGYIEGFIKQLELAFQIGSSAKFVVGGKQIKNVLICGLGGSGIGGAVVVKAALVEASVPVITCNDYHIPNFVDENTLVIANSYSGNTEETLSAVKKAQARNAQIACVTSGGELKAICEKNNYNHIVIPGGNPPRTCIAFSITEQLFILVKYGIFPESILTELKSTITLLKENDSEMRIEAKAVAKSLVNKLPVIYSTDKFEPVSIRFRQQLNENSKMLCWHNKFPELNHNEIVGWAEGNTNIAVLIFRNSDDFYRTQERMEFTKTIVGEKGASVTEVYSKGKSFIEKAFYLIYLTDWVSLYIANIKKIDPIEIEVIDALKNHLATVN